MIARQARREHCETLQELDKFAMNKSSKARLSRREHRQQKISSCIYVSNTIAFMTRVQLISIISLLLSLLKHT